MTPTAVKLLIVLVVLTLLGALLATDILPAQTTDKDGDLLPIEDRTAEPVNPVLYAESISLSNKSNEARCELFSGFDYKAVLIVTDYDMSDEIRKLILAKKIGIEAVRKDGWSSTGVATEKWLVRLWYRPDSKLWRRVK